MMKLHLSSQSAQNLDKKKTRQQFNLLLFDPITRNEKETNFYFFVKLLNEIKERLIIKNILRIQQ